MPYAAMKENIVYNGPVRRGVHHLESASCGLYGDVMA
jgi:hypothetical protein